MKTIEINLIEKVENPLQQIIIKLDYFDTKNHEEILDLVPVHLICSGFPQFLSTPSISLQNVKEFVVYSSDLDINSLFSVNQFEKVMLIGCTGVASISFLKDCDHVVLESCDNLTDFNSLGKQKRLSIHDNAHLTNVMNFCSIRKLILSKCYNLVDVSPLHGVYDLSLNKCGAVSDISALGGHHHLGISWCSKTLSGYDALNDIPRVKLCGCDILDVLVLSHAKVVRLEACNSLVDVSPLRGVRDVTLRNCSKIEDISMLKAVKKLTLYDLPNLKNYEGINQMTNLFLVSNEVTRGRFPNVKGIEYSTLPLNYILPLLSSFTNLHSLTVHSSSVRIEVSIDIHTVILEDCFVQSISGLGKNRVVRLFKCRGVVEDVSCLATVPLVSIIKCRFRRGAVNYESLKNVPRLKIDDCLYD